MGYVKVHSDWKNDPDVTTPVYAEDLEQIEQGIADAVRFDSVSTTTARDALPSPSEGDLCKVTNDSIVYRYNGSSWVKWTKPTATYTATVTSSIGTITTAVGTGAEFALIDGYMLMRATVQVVTAGSGAGFLRITLPSGYTLSGESTGASYGPSAGKGGFCIARPTENSGYVSAAQADGTTYISSGAYVSIEILAKVS